MVFMVTNVFIYTLLHMARNNPKINPKPYAIAI